MAQGLSVGRLIRTTVNLSPKSAQRRGFGTLLVIGDSDVMSPSDNPVPYTDSASVGAVYGLNSPEYLEAQAYFSQTPRPQQIMMGRWARTDGAAVLRGGVLNATEQLMSSWTSVTSGTFTIGVGTPSVPKAITVPTLAAQTNLNGVAAQITAGLTAATAGVTCLWDGDQFVFKTVATGSTAALTFLTSSGSGVDLSSKIKGTAALASTPTPGFDAEAPVDAYSRMVNKSALWFGSTFAASVKPTDDQNVAVAAFAEGLELERMFGITITNTTVLDSANSTDLASRLKALGYKRTFTQYSANPHAAASLFGRAFSVNFSANRSTITLMYKQEPGIVAEYLDEAQAQTLKAKNCNVFVNYVNDTAIIQYGVMANGAYFDEVHGLSWFKDALQNAEYNLLYTSKTKISQTDPGQNQLIATAAAACEEAVNNGLCAPGQWNADGFGQLSRGDYLPDGYYIWTSPLALQDQAIRETRTAPPLRIAMKLAGAFQELDIIVDVNR